MAMLLSRKERMLAAARALDALACPVCGLPLGEAEGRFCCAAGHSWDMSRRGTLSFLSAPREDFYSEALFAARSRVFSAGCYEPVADAIEALLPREQPQRLLDAGCGEGWYLARLLDRHPGWTGAGVDISSDAIRQASRQPAAALWCVADLRRLPFRDGAFTAVLDILTPASYDSFRRVLAPEGLLIKVYPGRDYLREIREARGLPPYGEGQVEAWLLEHTQAAAVRHVHAVCPVDAALWAAFVAMTPLNADLSPEALAHLAASPRPAVTVDLHVAACRFAPG